MIHIKGKSVSGGVAIGRLHFYENRRQQVERRHVADAAAELARFEAAAQTAAQQLGALHDRAVGEVGESGAQIFEIHQMMLEDLDYRESIADIIQRQKVNAEYAVAATGENFSQMFSEMDDEYMRARAADVKDVSGRLLRVLAGQGDALIGGEEPVIVAAANGIHRFVGFLNQIGAQRLVCLLSIPRAALGTAQKLHDFLKVSKTEACSFLQRNSGHIYAAGMIELLLPIHFIKWNQLHLARKFFRRGEECDFHFLRVQLRQPKLYVAGKLRFVDLRNQHRHSRIIN